MNRELLKISDLWGGYQEGVDILRGIDMVVHEGESVGVIGLNGSGKSTLGKAITNMIPYRNGRIVFDGQDITNLCTSEIANIGITIMQQGGRVFPNLSVWENLTLASGQVSKGLINHIRDIIPVLHDSTRKLQYISADRLSGGERHQLALAMALVTDPKLLILDEPSAGLDPKAVEEIYRVLGQISREVKVSIILIEQNIAKAIEFCDYTMMLELGETRIINSIGELERSMFNY